MADPLKLAQSAMREKRWSDAIKLWKEQLPLVEKHWELLSNLGLCYFKLGRMDQARKYLTKRGVSSLRITIAIFYSVTSISNRSNTTKPSRCSLNLSERGSPTRHETLWRGLTSNKGRFRRLRKRTSTA